MADYQMMQRTLTDISDIEWAKTERRTTDGHPIQAEHPAGYCSGPYWEWGVPWDLGLDVYQGEGDNADGYMVIVRSGGEVVKAFRCGDFLDLNAVVGILEPILRVSAAHVAATENDEHHRHLIDRQLYSDCAACGLIELTRPLVYS